MYASGLWVNWTEDWLLEHKVSFDGATKSIFVHPEVSSLSIKDDVYSSWKEWMGIRDHFKFPQAMRSIGGDPIGSGRYAGDIYFLMNDWKIILDHSVAITGTLFCEDGSEPFITLGNAYVSTSTVSQLVQGVAIPVDYEKLLESMQQIADAVWTRQIEASPVANSAADYLKKTPDATVDVEEIADAVWNKQIDAVPPVNSAADYLKKTPDAAVDAEEIAKAVWDTEITDVKTNSYGEFIKKYVLTKLNFLGLR